MAEQNYNKTQAKGKTDKPEKDIKPIVTTAKKRKRSALSKAADTFIQDDVRNIKTYILDDVLIPAVKKAISDVVTNGIDMLLYGESGRTKKTTSGSISYTSYYNSKNNDRFATTKTTNRRGYAPEDIVLETRGEAEDVLTRMDELIAAYDVVSVADLYDLVGVSGNYTDHKYGWSNLANAEPIRVRDGFMLKLPKAQPID